MFKITKLVAAGLFAIGMTATAQEQVEPVKAEYIGKATLIRVVPSIADQIKDGTFIPADNTPKEGNPKRRSRNLVVPGKGSNGPDMAIQKNQPSRKGKEPINVFLADVSQATPSDPTGAVGPNHYLAAWNTAFRIFDKDGTPLTPEASLSTIFPGNAIGDPIMLYDPNTDRYIFTEFDNSPNGFNIAISQGPDPVNDGWYVYDTGFTTGSFPDYTKFGVWSNGIYVTANIGASNRVFVVEYEEMLVGNPAQIIAFPLPGIVTSGFYSPQPFNVTNGTMPAADSPGYFVYMQDDAWSGITDDHLKIWSTTIDWDNPGDSEISSPQQIITEDFISVFDGGSFSNIPQGGGTNQDALQATIMNLAQYRRFAGYNSVVFNFVVDTDPSGGKLAGIRWYELRQTGGDDEPWEIYQEGTYISVDNKSAYSGSMAMDQHGNIGMGYTTSGVADRVALQYTGRLASDPLNEMTLEETLIIQSTAANPSNRLADYVQLTVDPVDDETMWHIGEAHVPNRRNYVAVFNIADELLSTPDFLNSDDDLTISTGDNQNFDIALTSDLTDERLVVTVYNISGQIVAENHITNEGGVYRYSLDMSYAASGVYVVKVHNNVSGISKKIIVK